MKASSNSFERLAESLRARGADVEEVKKRLKAQRIETPSWGYGNMGTRFHVFSSPGTARNIHEKVADAAFVNSLTGISPSVAMMFPWDVTDDWPGLRQYAEEKGMSLGALMPSLWEEEPFKHGSVCHPDPAVQKQALERIFETIAIMKAVRSPTLAIWLADGTNYAGQDSIRERKHRMEEVLAKAYAALPQQAQMLVEYKFFEPAFYHTDLADWGMAANTARRLGPRARVLVDTGHHAPGTNVEHIVAFLIDEGLLGGFHLNSRNFADDDLIVGSADPFELFLIYNEIVEAQWAGAEPGATCAAHIAYMVDESHNIEPKLEAMIQSVVNCQTAYAKALLVDREELAKRRADQDVLGAHRVLTAAFETDVRPLLAQVRVEMGLAPDPFAAYRASDYPRRIVQERDGKR